MAYRAKSSQTGGYIVVRPNGTTHSRHKSLTAAQKRAAVLNNRTGGKAHGGKGGSFATKFFS